MFPNGNGERRHVRKDPPEKLRQVPRDPGNAQPSENSEGLL